MHTENAGEANTDMHIYADKLKENEETLHTIVEKVEFMELKAADSLKLLKGKLLGEEAAAMKDGEEGTPLNMETPSTDVEFVKAVEARELVEKEMMQELQQMRMVQQQLLMQQRR